MPIALVDDPEAQAQYPVGWNLDAGNLLLYGIGGSGTTTALATLALSLAATSDPDPSAPLRARLRRRRAGAAVRRCPHVGRGDRRLRARAPACVCCAACAASFRPAAAWTRAPGGARPDRAAARRRTRGFASEHGDLGGDALREALARVWADGPELGIHVAIAADRLGAVPTALASLAQQRLAFQLADVADYAQFGLARRAIPQFAAGRAVVGGSAQVIQVARAPRPLSAEVAARTRDLPAFEGGPPPVEVLPESVSVDALLGAGRVSREPLFVPVGIGDETLEPAGFELYEGDHAIIAGPSRSGRTTALMVVAEVVSRLYPEIRITGVAPRRSALRECPVLSRVVASVDELAGLAGELRSADGPQLLLVDDADTVDDPARALSDLFAAPLGNLHAVVAGRGDALRTLGHWSVGARRSRVGLLLQPDVQVDGTLLGVTLPRRPAPPVRPGCGYRVDPGGFELVQVALAEVSAQRIG